MTFEQLLESFLGREIEGIEITEEETEILIYLNDDAVMAIGADDEGNLYIKRFEPELVN